MAKILLVFKIEYQAILALQSPALSLLQNKRFMGDDRVLWELNSRYTIFKINVDITILKNSGMKLSIKALSSNY